jgi:cell wall-associated NlpC family hydrolase
MGKHRPNYPADPRPVADFTGPVAVLSTHRSAAAAAALVGTAAMLFTPTAADAHVTEPAPVAPTVAHHVAADFTATPIPTRKAPAVVSTRYTVAPGDTLAGIGNAHHIPWQDIAAANGIKAPWTIYPGRSLILPGGGGVAPAPAPAPVAPASYVSSGAAAKAVQVALAQVGDRYKWAAGGPDAFDCSGLVQYAYKAAGISLSHSSAAQARMGRAVSRADLRPGDLVAYFSPVSHIGIYVGNGQVVQAANERYGVVVQGIDWSGKPTAYRRLA